MVQGDVAMDKAPLELEVDLGPMPQDSNRNSLLRGLRSLLDRRELCDVALVAGTGQVFPAHRAVLAASSAAFRERLPISNGRGSDGSNSKVSAEAGALPSLRLDNVKNAEAIQLLLDSVYGIDETAEKSAATYSYKPSSDATNRDVILLAREFGLVGLEEQASRWLVQELSTANVLQRLQTCEEFDLREVKDKILEQIVSNMEVLHELANDPAVLAVPGVLRDLLLRVLRLLGCSAPASSVATQDNP